MINNSSRWFRFWSIAGLLAIANLIVFDLAILRAPDVLQVQYTPDDGYYYLQLARNFVRLGYWTFDSGLSVTSGFHLLQAYLLASVYRLTGAGTESFIRYGLMLGNALTVSLLAFAWGRSYRSKDAFRMLFIALIASTPSFLINSTSVVEWSLAIWFAALYCFLFYDHARSPKARAGLFVLGFFLSLARSDAGLLSLSCFAASLIMHRRSGEKDTLGAAAAGLAGAVAGLALVFVHNYAFTGELIQSSARMKAYWAQFSPQPFYSSFFLSLSVLGIDLKAANFQSFVYILGFEFIAGAALLVLLGRRGGQTDIPLAVFRLDQETPRELTTALAAAICLCGYLIFYAFSGGLQNWYTVNLILPVFILSTSLGHYLDRRILSEQHFTMLWFSTAALLTIGINLYSVYPLGTARAPWPHQQAMLAAGKYLHTNPLDGRLGAWNAGVIGYYQGGTVVNIDGLVNEDIYPYAVANTLPLYLQAKGITYIIDFENMLQPPLIKRGGYDDPAFLGRLVALKQFDDGQYPEWKFLRLYRIEDR